MQWYKKVSLSLAAFSSVLTLGAGSAHAVTNNGADPAEDLAMLIAARFNLNPDDVHRVIDEHHAAMQEMAYGNRDWGTWLYDGENPVGDNIEGFDLISPYSSSPGGDWGMNQAVYEGLSQEQRNLINEKQSQVDGYLSEWSNMSSDARQSAVLRLVDAVNSWADENDIPRGYITFRDFGNGQNMSGEGLMGNYGFMPYSQAALNQLVESGNLTRDQRDLLISKQSEIQSFLDSLEGRTAEGRRLSLSQFRQQLRQWSADNNLPSRYVATWLNLGLIQFDSNGSLGGNGMSNQGSTSTNNVNNQIGTPITNTTRSVGTNTGTSGTGTTTTSNTVNSIQNGVEDNTNHPNLNANTGTGNNNNNGMGTSATTETTTTGTSTTSTSSSDSLNNANPDLSTATTTSVGTS